MEGGSPSLWLLNHLLEQVISGDIPPQLHWFLIHLHITPGGHQLQETALTRANITLHQNQERLVIFADIIELSDTLESSIEVVGDLRVLVQERQS